MFEFILAGFLIAVGLCIAGAATHLYQGFSKQQAMLRYDGKNYWVSVGHVLMSFVCGPYIMLQLGWRHEPGGAISTTSALLRRRRFRLVVHDRHDLHRHLLRRSQRLEPSQR